MLAGAGDDEEASPGSCMADRCADGAAGEHIRTGEDAAGSADAAEAGNTEGSSYDDGLGDNGETASGDTFSTTGLAASMASPDAAVTHEPASYLLNGESVGTPPTAGTPFADVTNTGSLTRRTPKSSSAQRLASSARKLALASPERSFAVAVHHCYARCRLCCPVASAYALHDSVCCKDVTVDACNGG